MAVKPVIDDTDSSLLDQLNDIRLSRDWSYRQLADDIARVTGFVISGQTLQPLLSKPRAQRGKPYDRTLHKIRLYVDAVRENPPAKPARKPKGRAA